MRNHSDDDYSQEILDKSAEIWTGAAKKRQKAMQSLVPYVRQNDSFPSVFGKQLDSIKQKLSLQKSASRQKDSQIDALKDRIEQLSRDKQTLIGEIEFIHSQAPQVTRIPETTINLEKTQNEIIRPSRKHKHKSQITESLQGQEKKLEQLPKSKIIQLLRSTSQYHDFANYHDSHNLIFLRELHNSGKCNRRQDFQRKNQWSDSQIIAQMSKLNDKESIGLKTHEQGIIIARIKDYYNKVFEEKAKVIRFECQVKLKKLAKQSGTMPEDMLQICKAKENQLVQQMTNKRTKSLKKQRL